MLLSGLCSQNALPPHVVAQHLRRILEGDHSEPPRGIPCLRHRRELSLVVLKHFAFVAGNQLVREDLLAGERLWFLDRNDQLTVRYPAAVFCDQTFAQRYRIRGDIGYFQPPRQPAQAVVLIRVMENGGPARVDFRGTNHRAEDAAGRGRVAVRIPPAAHGYVDRFAEILFAVEQADQDCTAINHRGDVVQLQILVILPGKQLAGHPPVPLPLCQRSTSSIMSR